MDISPDRHRLHGQEADNAPNGRVMLVGRDRVFYHGLLGQPALRNFGSATLYVSGGEPLQIDRGEGWEYVSMAWVPPYQPHRIRCRERQIAVVMIEPESVAMESVARCVERSRQPGQEADALARVSAGLARLQQVEGRLSLATAEFDRLFLGYPLPVRVMDPRVRRTLDRLCSDLSGEVSGEALACAEELSFSRFLHLFKEETGVPLRKYRAWRRARSLLYHVTRDASLTDIALETGYPDSTHFSHSIRRIYGLSPRTIVAGSRHLSLRLQRDNDGAVSAEMALVSRVASSHKSKPERYSKVAGLSAMAG